MDRVLHILPMNKMSGAERMVLLMCKNLKNYEPVVVCGGETLKKVFEKNKIKSYSVRFSNKNMISVISSLKKIIRENDIKIVHAHDNNASLVAYLTKRIFKLNIKVVSHIHNCYPFLKDGGLNKNIDKFIRNKYDSNITCGKIVTKFYKENADYFKSDKVLTISNAIDVDYITNIDYKKCDEVREKYNIPSDKRILGFIGRLDEQKGLIPFINEFLKHKDKFSDSKILIVGNGSQEKEIKELLNRLELEDLFILVGFQDDIYNFYPIIDIFFLPSLYEGLPMVLLEAMAFKKAVISMNVGSINEVINNNTGILVAPEKYDIFINKLIYLKENNDLIKRFGNNAYKLISTEFNINNYIRKVEDKYFEINNI